MSSASTPATPHAVVNNIYATPKSFMDMLVECSQFLDRARHDAGCSKNDVLDSMENRLSLLAGKLASHPACCDFRIELDAQPSTGCSRAAGSC